MITSLINRPIDHKLDHKQPCILMLGCGYVGTAFMAQALRHDFFVIPVSRDVKRIHEWHGLGYQPLLMRETPSFLDGDLLQQVTVIIDSIPLDRERGMQASQGDWLPDLLHRCPHLNQVIYLSSTSVYGDAGGAWVDELWPCRPSSIRGQQRLLAESAWHAAMKTIDKKATIFRLAGIYGSKRNIYHKLQTAGYRAIQWQPDHISNRIHVDDIVQCMITAITQSVTGVFNISDDTPSSHADYVIRLAEILSAPAPEILTPEQGKKVFSSAMLSFFQDSKRLDNTRMHAELLPVLNFPSFVDALN